MVEEGARAERIPALLRTLGLPIAGVTRLTRRGTALAFRLDLEEDRRVKAQVFPTAAGAARVHRFLEAAPEGARLPAPLLRAGRILVVEYVEGLALDRLLPGVGRAAEARMVRSAGRLLARLHAGRRPRGDALGPETYRRRITQATRGLVRAGFLGRRAAGALLALRPPARSRVRLTHADLCPENLVLAGPGRLRPIDVEHLALRPAAQDLARTVTRWPLTPDLERELLIGYADAGGDARNYSIHREFWIAAALAVSLRYRLRHDPKAAGPVAARLRAFAAELVRG